MPVPKSETKNRDIQVLRTFAAGIVLLQHLSLAPTLASKYLVSFTLPFYLGVEIFFVISGYVVTLSMLRVHEGMAPPTAAGFVLRRIFRLIPAILVFLALSLLCYYYVTPLIASPEMKQLFFYDWASFAESARGILTGTLINRSVVPLYTNGAMWSLSVEFQFYFFYAVLWFLFSPLKLRRYRKSVILTIASLLFAICAFTRLRVLLGHVPTIPCLIYILQYKFDFMMAGVVIACLQSNGWLESRFKLNLRGGAFSPGFCCVSPCGWPPMRPIH